MSDLRTTALPVQIIEVPQGVVLKRGTAEMLVTGEHAAEAVTRILAKAGSSSAGLQESDLRDSLRDIWPHADIANLIAELRKRNMLVDGVASFSYPETAEQVLAWNLGTNPAAAAASLDQVSINILGVNTVSRRLAESLTSVGSKVRVIDFPELRNVRLFQNSDTVRADAWGTVPPESYSGWEKALPTGPSVCLVACSDFGGLQLFADWNSFAYGNGWSFLPVILQNLIGLVGPLVIPGETSCFQCLLAREDANAPEPADRRTAELCAFQGQSIVAYHPSMASALGDVAALELTKHYAYGWASAAIGNTIEMNLLAATMVTRPILKVPGCPVCSSLNSRGRLEIMKEPLLRLR